MDAETRAGMIWLIVGIPLASGVIAVAVLLWVKF